MLEIVIFLLFLALIGALLGGNSFGESTRKGCGCFLIFILIMGIPILILSFLGKLFD